MKTSRFQVLSPKEEERIHATSMEPLSDVGAQVEWPAMTSLVLPAPPRGCQSPPGCGILLPTKV